MSVGVTADQKQNKPLSKQKKCSFLSKDTSIRSYKFMHSSYAKVVYEEKFDKKANYYLRMH
jgi:hypothetical protein